MVLLRRIEKIRSAEAVVSGKMEIKFALLLCIHSHSRPSIPS